MLIGDYEVSRCKMTDSQALERIYFDKAHEDNIYSGYLRAVKEGKRVTKHNQRLREAVY